ncbi:MAG: RluA family pseudouridine synthase [Erysipelotrichia bacterium]|nr:RluA family pseudouridine synthase [Erysipelotrichia bacterium]NCC54649.1 RluA family pseudouridine synthase [Erysipelotrichia bacterium]
MRKILIHENDANQRVDKFLSKALPKLPKSLMYKYIRNKKIKVNGKRCEPKQMLNVNDEFTCYIAEEFFALEKDDSFFKAPAKLDVLYEDEHLIIMNKEVGLLAHSDDKISDDTLINRMKHYLYKKGEYKFAQEQSFTPALCHRIDRNTQGIVIGAKTAQALRDMNKRIHDGMLSKKYLCIVEGSFSQKEGIIVAYHKKEQQVVSIIDTMQEGYKEVKTGYKVLKTKGCLSLLEVTLYSGKSHQIRAVMAHLNHSLYGDVKYGGKAREYPYQALCAYQVHFNAVEDSLVAMNGKTFTLNDIDFLSIMQD